MNENNLSGNQSDFILYTSNDGDVKVEVLLQEEKLNRLIAKDLKRVKLV